MIERDREKKKTGLLWRIFKWIGLCLLLLLLIASVFFQAPWKIITLLAIILTICTVLPKPYRKWFWLSAGAVVIALIFWIFLPEDNEGWRAYTFEKELAELEAKYTIPDEENAAFEYDEIFENLDINTNQPEFFVKSTPSSKDEPWLSKDHPETAEWFKVHQETIEKLLKASKKDECIFLPIKADFMSYGEYIERLPEIRQCAWFIISTANNDIAEGRIDAALEKYFCVIRMANHMYQQPAMLFHIVGFGVERLALEQLNQYLIQGQPGPKKLLLISNSIIGVENNWCTYWPRCLDFEKLYGKNMLCRIAYEKNSEGKVRLNRNILSLRSILSITDDQFQQKYPPPPYFRRKIYKAKTIFNWLNYPSSPEKLAKIIDAAYEQYHAMIEPDYDWSIEPKKWDQAFKSINFRRASFNFKYFIQSSIDMSEIAYYKHHEWYLKNLALRRGSRLLVVIKQYHIEHGTWPDSLDAIKSNIPAKALIDPVTGKDFEYENHGKRFSLFSESVNIWPK